MTVNAFLQQPIRRLSECYDVHVALNLNPSESLPGLEGLVTILSVGIERKVSPWRDLFALYQLVRLFRRYNFKIVHSVTPKAGLLAMLAAFLAGVDTRIHTFTGQVWATRSGTGRWLLKNIDRLIGCFATNILVDSPSQCQFLLDEGVVSAAKSSVLHKGSVSGVELQRFKLNDDTRASLRLNLGFTDTDVVFLFIGRLNRDKGVIDLASAFAIAAEVYPNIRLLMVGPDEENLEQEMLQIASKCTDKVRFVGFANNPQDYMSAADVLCLPSYREGFGNVIIEAAAVGIPTIGSRIYGVVDAIVEDQTGLLFEARNVSALALCLGIMATDGDLRRHLGRQAKDRAQADFSSELLGAAWLDYYQELS